MKRSDNMKENLTSIMNELKIGQVIKSQDGREFVFIEPKRTRAVVEDRESHKRYILKGVVEITDEIDQEVVDRLEEKAIQDFMNERKVRKMKKNQHFIGIDDKEYSFIKFNRTKFVFKDTNSSKTYTASPEFVKNILEKIQ